MAVHNMYDAPVRELRKPAIDRRLLEFFKKLYIRNKELFHKMFPKFQGHSFEEFSDHFEAMCSEAKKLETPHWAHQRANAVMQRSLSAGSPRIKSRGIGGDSNEEPLKLERFKVRTVDIDGGAPPAGVLGGGGGGGGKPGGPVSK